MSRFIFILEGGTAAEHNAVTKLAQDNGWGFWHYIENAWLLSGVPDSETSKSMSERIRTVFDLTKTHLVLKIPESAQITHWGLAQKDAWGWMMNNKWGDPG